jgi:hypothetical protein
MNAQISCVLPHSAKEKIISGAPATDRSMPAREPAPLSGASKWIALRNAMPIVVGDLPVGTAVAFHIDGDEPVLVIQQRQDIPPGVANLRQSVMPADPVDHAVLLIESGVGGLVL